MARERGNIRSLEKAEKINIFKTGRNEVWMLQREQPPGPPRNFQQAEYLDLITASRKSVRRGQHRQRPQEQTAWAWAGAGATFGRCWIARAAQAQLCFATQPRRCWRWCWWSPSGVSRGWAARRRLGYAARHGNKGLVLVVLGFVAQVAMHCPKTSQLPAICGLGTPWDTHILVFKL